jgi:hypothetical protein
VFDKLFGRGEKPKRDAFGVESSAGVASVPATTETTTVTSATSQVRAAPGMHLPGMQDLGAILASLKDAQEQSGGDREAMAEILRKQFAGESVVFEQANAVEWSATGQPPDPIALLATLTELHEKGVVSDEQFEEQKRRLLA